MRNQTRNQTRMNRFPHCRTLEEMRAMRRCNDVYTNVYEPVVSTTTTTTTTYPHSVVTTTVTHPPQAYDIPRANVLCGSQCIFHPRVCNQNSVDVRDWCRYCTQRFLFPERDTSCPVRPVVSCAPQIVSYAPQIVSCAPQIVSCAPQIVSCAPQTLPIATCNPPTTPPNVCIIRPTP